MIVYQTEELHLKNSLGKLTKNKNQDKNLWVCILIKRLTFRCESNNRGEFTHMRELNNALNAFEWIH